MGKPACLAEGENYCYYFSLLTMDKGYLTITKRSTCLNVKLAGTFETWTVN